MLIAVLFKIRLSVVIGAVRTEIEYVPEVKLFNLFKICEENWSACIGTKVVILSS